MNLSIGNFQVYHLRCEDFRLDGGAMFGVVPRVLWERTNPPDERNRIKMTCNCLLVTDGRIKAIIETGLGTKGDKKFREIYAVEGKSIEERLGELDVAPEDIHAVILSHLHFDHCGGAVRAAAEETGPKERGAKETGVKGPGAAKPISGSGTEENLVPTFPKALYFIQKKELEAALNPNEKTRASYERRNFEPLLNAGRVKKTDGNHEIYPGISVFMVEGHSEGMQCTLIESGGQKLFFSGDLFPLKAHVSLPYIMGYDLFPMKTLETKRMILRRAVQENWCVTFAHDPDTPFAFLEEADGKIIVKPV